MNVIQAFILGITQGLTEFIPVSSSGHLVLVHHALGVFDHGLAFDVALHGGTLLALIIYFWKDLGQYVIALFKKTEHSRLAWLLVAATIPAAIIGYLLESKAENQFRSVRLVSLNLLVFGCVMLLAEYFYQHTQRRTKLDDTTTKQALTMGLAQAAAVIPGVSRSGSTITAGLLTGLDRVSATRFSFLLGIPIIGGAILKVFTEGGVFQQARNEQTVFLVGIITALVSGLFAIRFMLKFLSGHSLALFAYYRIALALLALAIVTLR